MYRQLDSERLVLTLERLGRRISERFPDAGLCQVAAELTLIAREAKERSEWIDRPHRGIRVATALFIALIVGTLAVGIAQSEVKARSVGILELVPLLESALNDVVLIGAAIFFLVTIETRLKRHRALRAIHELRALAHVVDIRQLTKDPERVLKRLPRTESSPAASMTRDELSRYLEYCSEMFSLIGKVAVLYVQRFDDEVALKAVNEVESLCTGLSRKVWQKIMILHMTD